MHILFCSFELETYRKYQNKKLNSLVLLCLKTRNQHFKLHLWSVFCPIYWYCGKLQPMWPRLGLRSLNKPWCCSPKPWSWTVFLNIAWSDGNHSYLCPLMTWALEVNHPNCKYEILVSQGSYQLALELSTMSISTKCATPVVTLAL